MFASFLPPSKFGFVLERGKGRIVEPDKVKVCGEYKVTICRQYGQFRIGKLQFT